MPLTQRKAPVAVDPLAGALAWRILRWIRETTVQTSMKAYSMLVATAAALLACERQPSAPVVPEGAELGSDWIQIASTTEGGSVSIDPTQTKADAASQLTDVVVRVRHPYLEGWRVELPDYTTETVFQTEQVRLRFDCASKAMAVVSREALDAADRTIARHDTPAPLAMAPVKSGGVGEVVLPRACPPEQE